MANPGGEVTLLLAEMRLGHEDALARLMPIVYAELRRLAGHYLRGERIGHTLQPTALINEAFLRLVGQDHAKWEHRGQFIGVAAQVMRRVLVDYARQRATGKRAACAVTLDEERLSPGAVVDRTEEILAVEEVLECLGKLDPQQARIVELRYFGGLSVDETAECLGISPRTVKRDWAVARAWLRAQLAERKSP
ncbi:MAG TPA: sigma-70 family RNA polymerase sigma factor [Bryobacteraceae bacterium]|nr:sigma-70 family RNA polymerase sigma factor [Bryobacteraceae bacterium]